VSRITLYRCDHHHHYIPIDSVHQRRDSNLQPLDQHNSWLHNNKFKQQKLQVSVGSIYYLCHRG